MSLTLGSTAMPSLQVDEERVRKADDIFEKEQEGVAEFAAADKPDAPAPMYVNENG